jgi:Galactose-3-O-sulfotransferase
VNEETLEAAKHNLEEHFAVAGIAERFEETLALLQRRLGWKVQPFTNASVNREHQPVDAASPEELEAIRHFSRLDLDLYAGVQERMNREIAAAGATFQRELAGLRRRNRWYRFGTPSVSACRRAPRVESAR